MVKIWQEVKSFLIWAACAVAFILGFIVLNVQTDHLGDIFPRIEDTAETAPVAIVLGASVNGNGTPSDALRDRLLVGEDLYRKKKVEKILLTGDDGGFHQDEITVMHKFLTDRGVPETAILIDGQGYRTYESCRRAKSELHVDKAIVVTQRFHMARALYLCNALGVESIGVTSDLQAYQKSWFFWLRDLAASLKAFWEINKDKAPGEIAT